jgi:hypothetical protein
MRPRLLIPLLFAACGSDQVLEHDLEPIILTQAPVEPGGPAQGALLAQVSTPAGLAPLLVDTAFTLDSLAHADCTTLPAPGWTYTGDVDVRDGSSLAVVRARFRSVELFDICPGPVGDPSVQPAGLLGGPLLSNFSLGLTLPRTPSEQNPTRLTLWPSFPGTDDQLAIDGMATLHFDLRGGAAVGPTGGEPSVTLPNSRIVLAACAAARAFSATDPVETCVPGEVAQKASGVDLLLAVGTGSGPLVLGQHAWDAMAPRLGVARDAGTAGLLYTPFSTSPIAARYVDIPRLALLQGTTDNNWLGPCTELARARRIEWVMSNQDQGTNACFQRCDADGSKAVFTRNYLEVGGTLRAAIVPDTSDVMRALNADVPPNPQVDGMVGAATLAGTVLRLDYPGSRVVAACEAGSTRDTCFAAPSCPPLSKPGQTHRCFGQPDERGFVSVCK